MHKQVCYLMGMREAKENIPFARYVGQLLDAPLSLERPRSRAEWTDKTWVKRVTGNCALTLAQPPDVTPGQRWRIGSPGRWLAEKSASSTLLIRKPRWPFRRLLLIMRNEKSDEGAAAWALRLARESGAEIAILPVVPSPPNFLRVSDDLDILLTDLLNSTTPFGEKLRRLLSQLDMSHIRYELRLQRGTPEWQIAQALDEGDHELVIIGVEEGDWLSRWLVGEIIAPLLRWLDHPILLAKS